MHGQLCCWSSAVLNVIFILFLFVLSGLHIIYILYDFIIKRGSVIMCNTFSYRLCWPSDHPRNLNIVAEE